MRFNRFAYIGAALLLAGIQPALAEPEFAVTRQGNEFLFDYVADKSSDITALGFRIDLGNIDSSSVDLSRCTEGIPSTHLGFCKANPGFIKVLVYSNQNEILSTTHIGSISVAPGRDRSPAARLEGQQRGEKDVLDRNSTIDGLAPIVTGDLLDQVKVRNLNYSDVNARDIKGEVLQ